MPKTSHRSQLKEGLVLDDWCLKGFIDAGGQGEVWRVKYTKGRRPISAIKVAFCANEKHRARFVSEFEVLSRLSHPNVVPVVKSGTAHVQLETGPTQLLYYIMPLAAGTLAAPDILRQGLLRLVPRYRELLTGIIYLHEQQVLHRDLKPSNVLLLNETGCGPRTVASDFGIASDAEAPKAVLTATYELLGSHGYMAPELFTGAPPSVRTEIFALGRILQWLLAEGQSDENPASDLNGRAREALDACGRRATAHDPQARFSSVNELADALPDLHIDVRPRRSAPSAPAPQVPACPIQPKTRIGHRSRAGNEREVFWSGGSHLSLWVAPASAADRNWDGFELSKHAASLPWPNPGDRGHHDGSRNEHGRSTHQTARAQGRP